MFVRRWKYERLQGELAGARLFIDHLKRLVEYERNRAHPITHSLVAEVTPPAQVEQEEVILPEKVSRAVAAASRPGTEIHTQLVEAAHASLQEGLDEEAIAEQIAIGERSFDSLLKIG
jgi:hypothetical protein